MSHVLCLATSLAIALSSGPAWGQGVTRRVSLGDTGQEGSLGSSSPSLDHSGRRVAFTSLADDLVPGDTPLSADVFVHELASGTLMRVSVNYLGGNPDGGSYNAHLSADGNHVAFDSDASDLVFLDTTLHADVYLRDLVRNVTKRVSLAHDGAEPAGACTTTSISAEGRRVAFESVAPNLVPGDTNGLKDVFVRDMEQGWIRRVSVSSSGVEANAPCEAAALSGDGLHVAFYSSASNLVPGDTNGVIDVFVHHLETGQTEIASLAWDGSLANGTSTAPALSGDGSKVVFASSASNLLPGDANGVGDVFLRDLSLGSLELVSEPYDGGFAGSFSLDPAISLNGRYQLFRSFAQDLIPNDHNQAPDLFVRDSATGSLERVNLTSLDQPMSEQPHRGALSGDGRAVAFDTFDDSLVPFDRNWTSDVFVRERWGAAPTLVSYCTPSTPSLAGCEAVLGAAGVPSLSQGSRFRIDSGPALGGTLGTLFFGVKGPSLQPFGSQGGIDCVAGLHFRLPPAATGGVSGACDGNVVHALDELAAAQPAIVLPGATVHAQLWLRDPANPDGFALSSGVWFQVLP